jgi:uncharacterized membrane protein (DUF2068 family)
VPQLDRGLLLIAILKLVKASLLAAVGLCGLLLPQAQLMALIARAATILHPGGGFIHRALGHLDGITATQERTLAALALAYAAVFATEGLGLLSGRRWAEWLTVAVTGSFVPFELYELIHRPGIGRAMTLVINLAVVAYLVRRRMARA